MKTEVQSNNEKMKTFKSIAYFFTTLAIVTFGLMACDSNPDVEPQGDLLPESFRVDIPSTISNKNFIAGGRYRNGRMMDDDSVRGDEIYELLGFFVALADESGELVEAIIENIRVHNIDRILTLTIISDDDGREKNLTVISDSDFEGKTWNYQLTITDAESEGNADGGKALQVFWNTDGPPEGIAIINLFNMDREENPLAGDATFRINYSETGEFGYEAHMEVLISGIPLPSPLLDPFAVNNMRLFAGKNGDVVDVWGNSNHPNATFFSGDQGFNWAFVASGNEIEDIGVAEVGLPPSDLDETDRSVLLEEYSVKNVLINEVTAAFPGIDQDLLATFLTETSAPGYFDSDGFISGGVSPGAPWDELALRLQDLTPFNPSEVSSLQVGFK